MTLNSITISQHARPLRIAFLVDRNTYKEAMEINTSLWGGEANPLVPVKVSAKRAEKDIALGILHDFDPDIIVNTTPHEYPYIEEVYKSERYRYKTLISKAGLFQRTKPSNKRTLKVGMSIVPILREIWGENKIPSENSHYSLINNVPPEWANLFLATLGRYPSVEPLSFATDYKTVMKPTEIDFATDVFDNHKLYERGSPIHLTLYDLEEYGGGFSSMSTHTLYLGKMNSWQDLVEFWNIRASGTAVVFIPYEHYRSFKSSANKLIKDADYAINPNVQNEATLLSSGSTTQDELNEYADWLRDELGHNLVRRNFGVQWNRRHSLIAPDISIVDYRTAEKEEVVTFDEDRSIQFYPSAPSMLSRTRGMREKRWANVIKFSGYYGQDFCFSFPVDRKVQDLVSHAMLQHETVRLSRKGIVSLTGYSKSHIFFNPLKTYDVIEALFKTAGYRINLSQPGRITQNLINFLGGIRGARFLKVDGIRHAISEINKKSIDASNITNIIGRNWHSADDNDMILKAGETTPLTPNKAFDALVSSKLIRPGIDFKCSQCGQTAWYSVKDFGEQFECTYCFLKQDVPRLDKTDWKYTTNGLARIKDEGYGSLPVILSLWRYDHFTSFDNAQSLTSIELHSDGFDCEIDYVYITTSSSGKYDLVIGEAKGYEEITPKVLKKMKRIANSMNKLPYISLSSLRDELTPQEKKRINALIRKGYRVVVLTRRELEPYDLYDRFDGLREKYAHSLAQMARNTQQLNLVEEEEESEDGEQSDQAAPAIEALG